MSSRLLNDLVNYAYAKDLYTRRAINLSKAEWHELIRNLGKEIGIVYGTSYGKIVGFCVGSISPDGRQYVHSTLAGEPAFVKALLEQLPQLLPELTIYTRRKTGLKVWDEAYRKRLLKLYKAITKQDNGM